MDIYIAKGLLLAVGTIGFVVLIISECFFIHSWRETKEFVYLGTSIITAILIILFGVGLGICIVDYVGGA